jgi:DNA-binding beta-propeller fold protein YncE
MKYSVYIGRVGALAVALGIGAAVATSPGLALAQDGDAGSTAASTESSPANPTSTDTATTTTAGTDADTVAAQATDPPSVSAQTNQGDDTEGAAENYDVTDADHAADVTTVDPTDVAQPTTSPAAGDQSLTSGGESHHQNLQQTSDDGQQPTPTAASGVDADDSSGALQSSGGGTIDSAASAPAFKTAAVDESASDTALLTTQAPIQEAVADTAPNPIAALIALPFRIVNSVLAAVVGGPSAPAGENPLFLGLLAYVRRQFSTFTQTFSNQAPIITGAQVDENADGSFTITVRPTDASDPEGAPLSFSASDGAEGTVEKTGANTFTYTPGTAFDGDDTVTLTASDPGGLFGVNRKSATVDVDVVRANQDPTQPQNPQEPVQQDDGTVDATYQFDPAHVTDVTIAPGFEPKYYTAQETYDPETGEYSLHLTPTQAGQLRAALGLDTTDSVGLQVTTTEPQTVAPVMFRMAALAAPTPDYTVNLPDIPAGHFVVDPTPIVTSPDSADPSEAGPAGVYVTDRYVYVVNAQSLSGDESVVTIFGADPDKPDYLQKVGEVPVGHNALFGTIAGDRLYVTNVGTGSSDPSTLTVIDMDGADPTDEADDNTVLAPVELDSVGYFNPVASPDGTKIYLINQITGKVAVIDTDPSHTGTFDTVTDEFAAADPPVVVQNEDGTITQTAHIPLSGAFNADGSRFYVQRAGTSGTFGSTGVVDGPHYGGDVVVVDTTTNTVIGDPLATGYGGYVSSDGKYLYVPTLSVPDGFNPFVDSDLSNVAGSVDVVDIQNADNPAIAADLPVGNLPVNVAFSPDKSLAYVVDTGKGTVWVIDTVNQQVLDMNPATPDVVDGLVFDTTPSAQLGEANIVAASPDGTRLFVTNYADGTFTDITFVPGAVSA